MKRFAEFIIEAVPAQARQDLYHWSYSATFENILRVGKLGVVDMCTYNPINCTSDVKPGWLSFTRNKNYRIQGNKSDILFVVDGDKIRNKYKMRPYADQSVVKSPMDDTSFLKGRELRWEAEEKIYGPIDLKDIKRIEATADCIKKWEQARDLYLDNAKLNRSIAKEMKEKGDDFRYDPPRHRPGANEYHYKFAADALAKDPKWLPPKWGDVDSWLEAEKHNKEVAAKYQAMIDKIDAIVVPGNPGNKG